MGSNLHTAGVRTLKQAGNWVSLIISVAFQSESQKSVTFLLLFLLTATNMSAKVRAGSVLV